MLYSIVFSIKKEATFFVKSNYRKDKYVELRKIIHKNKMAIT